MPEASFEPSVSGVGDSCDDALVETTNGSFEAEVIQRCGPWRSFEFTTRAWVDWFDTRRLLEPIGDLPPAEAEAHGFVQPEAQALAA